MTELQTTVEFSVEFYKFYNVDLFQRGYYQIRTSLRLSPRYTSKIEVSLSNGNSDKNSITSSQIVFPSCVVTGTAVSKTFQILYRNEEVLLDDVILFKVHLIVDSRKIEDSLLKADIQLVVELWFTEQPFGPDHHNSIQCVSTRSLRLHLCPLKGLHHHLPVLFDYFHLSAVTLTVHGCLVAIHQPYMTVSRPGKSAWLTNSPKVGNRFQASASLESVLFGNIQGMKSSPSLTRLNQARCIHQSICTILLSSHESLQSKFIEYMKLLPHWQQLKIEVTDCSAKLNRLKELSKDHRWPRSKSQRTSGLGGFRSGFRNVDAEDELLAIVNSDIAQLCAENIILWQQFLESFTLKDRIQQHLTREHHIQRVKRFAEGFFVVENSRQAIFHCAEQSYQTYLSISDSIRKTKYFSSLPSLTVECPDLDGNAETLPVIFEDHYQDMLHNSNNTTSSAALSVHDIGFNLKSKDIKSCRTTLTKSKKATNNSDTELCKLDTKNRRKSKFLQDEIKPQVKTVGCFSTGTIPKSSMSSEDLYYVVNGNNKKEVNQSYKRKMASLPRGSASVEEKCPPSCITDCVVDQIQAKATSTEHIAPFRDTLDHFAMDGKYMRITSSAAVPKYVHAKRKEAFRASGGSKSLSAVEECSRTLPKNHRASVFFPRLETVPLFTQLTSEINQKRRPLATSNSMDLGVHHSNNGSTALCGHWTQRGNNQWVSNIATNKSDLQVENSNETKHQKLNTPLDAELNPKNQANEEPDRKSEIEEKCSKPSTNDLTTEDVNYLKKKLKETLKLELKPLGNSTNIDKSTLKLKTINKSKQRMGNKVRKKLNGGLYHLMNQTRINNSPPVYSTSSDSIIVLTGYKKLEQSESLPIGLAQIGQADKEKGIIKRHNRLSPNDGHIAEENSDDELQDFQCSSSRHPLRKTKVTRSMPNISIGALTASQGMLKKDMSMIVTSESMPDFGGSSEASTEMDDFSNVSSRNATTTTTFNNNHIVRNSHWSSSDSAAHRFTRSLGRPPKVIVLNSDTDDDDNDLLDTPKVEQSNIIGENIETFVTKKNIKKKRRQRFLAPNDRNAEEINKKIAWLHHRRNSLSSTNSSSSSTSERSGWVSSQCSSLDASSCSDITKESSKYPSPSSGRELETSRSKQSNSNQMKKKVSPSITLTEEDKHIYEEIHLPPEEFRDPWPASLVLQPPSPFSNSNRGGTESRIRNLKNGAHSDEKIKSHQRKDQRRLKNSSLDIPGNGRLKQRPNLTRSQAVAIRPRPNHYMKDHILEVHNENQSACRNDPSKTRYREPITAEYLDTKCTILEMFTDTTFCGYAGNTKNWPSPTTTENGTSPNKKTTIDGVYGEDKIPAAPPPPRNRTPNIPAVTDLVELLSSTTTTTTTTCNTKEESNKIQGDDDSQIMRSSRVGTLVTSVTDNTVKGVMPDVQDHLCCSFVKAKEDFKNRLRLSAFIYSDCPLLASTIPYFHVSEDFRLSCNDGLHLVVCVHGLDGNSADLRLVKTYLELGLPCSNLEFLMSERNQGDTFSDFEKMTDKLVAEILYHIEAYRLSPVKISFIGHSLGNIIIRSALARPQMKPWLHRLHTFLSLSGPHLGTLYNSSGLVNMGLWFMQKWKKSGSLLQLSMKDATDIRRTFLYKLSQKSGLEHFKNILLFGSSQDRYVPIHSARIELCKAALKDTSIQGMAYRDMVHGLLQPVARNPNITFVRYDVHHALPNTANSLIGRAAHIAVLDSELFIEKFLTVCGLKYFK